MECGPYGITSRLLSELADEITFSLMRLFNILYLKFKLSNQNLGALFVAVWSKKCGKYSFYNGTWREKFSFTNHI